MNKRRFKFTKIIVSTVMVLCLLLSGCSEEIDDSNVDYGVIDFSAKSNVAEIDTKDYDMKNINNPVVALKVKGYGTIVVELYPDVAPITVENFINLAESGFYDGLTFHRVIQGFMIQGGDPKGDGTGGSENTITGEFSANGIANTLKHTKGVISMARSDDKNSASSQFFICHATSAHLNGQYAGFGKVIDGMDVVDKIAVVETDSNDKPVKKIVMEKVVVDKNEVSGDPTSGDTSDDQNDDSNNGASDILDSDDVTIDTSSAIPVTMKVKGYGTIKLELYPDIAPITVQNFVDLASKGFYDGLIFHRVIKDFMVQGGDPEGTGMGGSDKNIKGEFSANGVANSLSHKRGVISMARAAYSYDSASSQFFICHADSLLLDGQYAAFGKVTEGIEVVDAIASVATDSNDKPTSDVIIESVVVDKGE